MAGYEKHIFKNLLKESTRIRDVHIMHRGELFMDGLGALGELALWVVDCR